METMRDIEIKTISVRSRNIDRDSDRNRCRDRGRQYTLTQWTNKQFNIELNKQVMRIEDISMLDQEWNTLKCWRIYLFEEIRMDHTNCLQVAIKTFQLKKPCENLLV